jgi:hypothetical protein
MLRRLGGVVLGCYFPGDILVTDRLFADGEVLRLWIEPLAFRHCDHAGHKL